MLFRGYSRSSARFLLWSSLCFAGLAANNILLLLDKVIFPDTSLVLGLQFQLWRDITAIIGLGLLLYGLVWDVE